ncbi:hypothetical protein [Clostridium sporogenes]|uniref:hypothetical protein n=1 Tax=Clostridium sporogenes TaxID=1509 RepID=UPI003DA59F72
MKFTYEFHNGKVSNLKSDGYFSNNNNCKTKEKYRIIKIVDLKNRKIIFITNVFNLSTEEIT